MLMMDASNCISVYFDTPLNKLSPLTPGEGGNKKGDKQGEKTRGD